MKFIYHQHLIQVAAIFSFADWARPSYENIAKHYCSHDFLAARVLPLHFTFAAMVPMEGVGAETRCHHRLQGYGQGHLLAPNGHYLGLPLY